MVDPSLFGVVMQVGALYLCARFREADIKYMHVWTASMHAKMHAGADSDNHCQGICVF